ncbi:MAG: adenylate/guanylate cyclase domain-containing protein, partial [Candidatus Binatia bacterium]
MNNPSLPTGTVTFIFTDIEDSTRQWQEQPEVMTAAHAQHDAILRAAIESNHGYIFQIVGDSFSGAFHNAMDGLNAAVKAQRALQRTSEFFAKHPRSGAEGAENSEVSIRVRMGLHTGTAELLQ